MATYNYPSSVIENAPKTNVGTVSAWGNQFFAPRDPRVKDYLGYSAYDRIRGPKGVPQLGIPDAPDKLVPNQGEIYNTELNPFDPSSKFWPYEPDYAGIMSLKAYEQAGEPVTDDKLGMAAGVYNPATQKIRVDPQKFQIGEARDPEEERDTLFHEGKHFFIDKYGQLVPKAGVLSVKDEQAVMHFADMWRKNPNYSKNMNMMLTKKQAEAFMELQNLGRKWFKNQTKFQGGIEPGIDTLKRLVVGEEDEDLDDLRGTTFDQRMEQYEAYRDPKRGDVTTPTMSQQAMVEEAQRTGGTVNPHEATKTFSRPRQPVRGPHGKAEGGPVRLRGGGIVGLDMPVSKPSLFQQLFDYGRNVSRMQLGGGVTGAGTGTSDSIPAMLSDGEFVMTAKSVEGMGGGNREAGFKKLNTMMKSAEARAV